jgi:hypothetical protein
MFRDAALARCDAGIRGLGGSDESAAAAGALRKGCPMTMLSEIQTKGEIVCDS